MKIYLASPFFSPPQLAVCQKIETAFSRYHPKLMLYSPRLDGVLADMTPGERQLAKKKIFELNVCNIDDASVMVAVVDGRDVGTTWEMGYFYRLLRTESGQKYRRRLVTYTDENYGLNVMIQESVDAHCRGMADLKELIAGVAAMDDKVYSRFHDFHPAVT